jgi:hypothetical protein
MLVRQHSENMAEFVNHIVHQYMTVYQCTGLAITINSEEE